MDGCQRHSFDTGAISRPSTARAPHSRHVLASAGLLVIGSGGLYGNITSFRTDTKARDAALRPPACCACQRHLFSISDPRWRKDGAGTHIGPAAPM